MVLCATPGDRLPDIDILEIDIEDKLAHLGMFAVQAYLLLLGKSRRRERIVLSGASWQAWLIGTGFGLATELLQHFAIPMRYGNLGDFLADSLGALLGVGVYRYGSSLLAPVHRWL
jgi:VanZ family protein